MNDPLARRLRQLLAGPGPRAPRWPVHEAMFDRAVLIVTFYYVATAAYLYEGSRRFSRLSDSLSQLDLLWPVRWLQDVGLDVGGPLIAHVGLAAAILGIVAWRFLLVRVLVSLALLQYAAYDNSFGAINHGDHEWFWLSVCFWFLPTGRLDAVRATRSARLRFLTGFALAQGLILLFYTLSGIYKTYFALAASAAGQAGGFSPDAMAITLAWQSIQSGVEPMWAGPIIDYPLLGWPLYLTLYYIELVAVVVFFRPRLQQAWGVMLIAFHFGTLLFMDLAFPKHVLINGLLFVMTPFALGHRHEWAVLKELPLLGRIPRLFRKSDRRAVSPSTPAEAGPAAPEPVRGPSAALDRLSAPSSAIATGGTTSD
jgi:hypothetical protein